MASDALSVGGGGLKDEDEASCRRGSSLGGITRMSSLDDGYSCWEEELEAWFTKESGGRCRHVKLKKMVLCLARAGN